MNVTFVDVFFNFFTSCLCLFLEAQLGNYEQIKGDLEPVAQL